MDITNFMTWFVAQTVKIFTSFFNLLDSITFAGTSVLKVSVTVIILSSLLGVILTIGKTSGIVATRSERVVEKGRRNNENKS